MKFKKFQKQKLYCDGRWLHNPELLCERWSPRILPSEGAGKHENSINFKVLYALTPEAESVRLQLPKCTVF